MITLYLHGARIEEETNWTDEHTLVLNNAVFEILQQTPISITAMLLCCKDAIFCSLCSALFASIDLIVVWWLLWACADKCDNRPNGCSPPAEGAFKPASRGCGNTRKAEGMYVLCVWICSYLIMSAVLRRWVHDIQYKKYVGDIMCKDLICAYVVLQHTFTIIPHWYLTLVSVAECCSWQLSPWRMLVGFVELLCCIQSLETLVCFSSPMISLQGFSYQSIGRWCSLWMSFLQPRQLSCSWDGVVDYGLKFFESLEFGTDYVSFHKLQNNCESNSWRLMDASFCCKSAGSYCQWSFTGLHISKQPIPCPGRGWSPSWSLFWGPSPTNFGLSASQSPNSTVFSNNDKDFDPSTKCCAKKCLHLSGKYNCLWCLALIQVTGT